jgi:WW domain-containing oxidoreductase
MSLVAALKGKGPSGFGYGSTTDDVTQGLDLSGRSFLVTGATSGLGLETTRALTARGARVLAAGRSIAPVRAATRALGELAARVTPIACELAEPSSVRAAVDAVKAEGVRLSAIVANAGIMALPKLETKYGVELQLFTNHVGHFILVTGLLDVLTEDGRVVMVSSEGHKLAPRGGVELDNLDGHAGYDAWRAYGQSKLANILFARRLARRFAGTQRTANALHPGVIATNLTRHSGAIIDAGMKLIEPLFLKSIPQGAATQTYLACHPAVASTSGAYFADVNVARASRHGQDDALADALWTATEAIVARV